MMFFLQKENNKNIDGLAEHNGSRIIADKAESHDCISRNNNACRKMCIHLMCSKNLNFIYATTERQ
jgi:hypothetical protein